MGLTKIRQPGGGGGGGGGTFSLQSVRVFSLTKSVCTRLFGNEHLVFRLLINGNKAKVL